MRLHICVRGEGWINNNKEECAEAIGTSFVDGQQPVTTSALFRAFGSLLCPMSTRPITAYLSWLVRQHSNPRFLHDLQPTKMAKIRANAQTVGGWLQRGVRALRKYYGLKSVESNNRLRCDGREHSDKRRQGDAFPPIPPFVGSPQRELRVRYYYCYCHRNRQIEWSILWFPQKAMLAKVLHQENIPFSRDAALGLSSAQERDFLQYARWMGVTHCLSSPSLSYCVLCVLWLMDQLVRFFAFNYCTLCIILLLQFSHNTTHWLWSAFSAWFSGGRKENLLLSL